MHRTEMTVQGMKETDRKMWFSMWFLASIATFGVAFLPMFYRLIDSRNKHFRRGAKLENQIAEFLRAQGKEPPATAGSPHDMNAKALAALTILIIPAFIIVYYLSRDLRSHEEHQDVILASVFPERKFMPQTIPIKKYALITIATLGVGGIYWLYKIINLYNTHFKLHQEIGKEIARLMEEKTAGESV
jgi:hypothetical protein